MRAVFFLFVPGSQHLERGIVRKQGCAILDPLGDGLGQWFQQGGGFAYPVRHRRAIQIDALTCIYLALAIKWQVICKLTHQNMCQQARPRTTPFNRARRHRGLRYGFTAAARHTWADDLVHNEPARNVFQLFGHILAQF